MSTPAADADRAMTAAALNEAMRASSALSVLLSQAIADRVGISPTDLESLDLVVRHGPLTAGRLAELTGLTTGAVTGLVDRLERRGYVRREADPGDRRRVLVRAVAERAEADLGPPFAGLAAAMDELAGRYSDVELAVVLDFVERAGAIAAEQIARIRAEAGAAAAPRRGRGVRAWGRRQVPPTGQARSRGERGPREGDAGARNGQ